MIFAPIIDPISYESFITPGSIVITTLITATSGIIIALITRNNAKTREILAQTKNEHHDSDTPNLRDNIDVNHDTTIKSLETISESIVTMLAMQHATNTKVDRLFTITSGQRNRIEELEDTITKKEVENSESSN